MVWLSQMIHEHGPAPYTSIKAMAVVIAEKYNIIKQRNSSYAFCLSDCLV